MKIYVLIFFTLLLNVFGYSQGYFEETPAIKAAYNEIVNLKLETAQISLEKIKVEEPNNLMVLHLENYIDFFTVFINEEKNEFKRLEKNKGKRIKQIKNHGDKTSPYYLFVQAEIELQWALVRAKFNQRFKAASESYNAYVLLTENQQKFPNFIANKKSLSAIHVLVESIPGFVRSLLDIKGSIALGTKEITEVIEYSENNEFLYRDEAIAIYTYILFYQNNRKKDAWEYVSQSELDPSKSLLACFLISTMATKVGENDHAIEVLKNRPRGKDYAEFRYLDFMLGKAKLNRLDVDADQHFNDFLNNFKGQHYIKEAYQKLAWYNLVVKDISHVDYQRNMNFVLKKGEELIDGDKQALKEAKRQIVPDPILLKARLLYDGGYLKRAERLLLDNAQVFLQENEKRLEYNYRLGRISQDLGQSDNAIKCYRQVIEQGERNDLYFACNAALQIGLIFEKSENFEKAKSYFKKCLTMSPSDYKNSLHQKAKSGLNRLK